MRYDRPTSTAEVLHALATDGARVLVGGTDLLVGMRHRTIEPTVLIDLKHVADLPEPLTVDDEGVRIGPTLTLADLAADSRVQTWYPALVEAALTVGSVAIRNRASLVGNCCNASPAADTAPALLALGALVQITGPDGERTVSLDDFFLGPRRTLCAVDELVTALHLPRPAPGTGSAFGRMTRRRGVDLGTVSVAAVVGADDSVRLGLGAVAPRPLVTESRLRPGEPVDDVIEELVSPATPISDVRAGSDYRRAMLRVLTRRALETAVSRRLSEEAS